MKQERNAGAAAALAPLAGWLLERLRPPRRPPPQLAVIERIALGPRQSLALVEAEGRRFLVATSADGAPAFHALDEPESPGRMSGFTRPGVSPTARVSW